MSYQFSFREMVVNAVLAAVLTVVLTPFTVDAWADRADFWRHARITEAALVSEPWDCSWRDCSYAWVRFRTQDGVSHRVKLKSTYPKGFNGVQRGGTLRIWYDVRDSSHIIPAGEEGQSVPVGWTVAASCAAGYALLNAVVAWVRRPARFRKASPSGQSAEASRTGVRTVTVWRRGE